MTTLLDIWIDNKSWFEGKKIDQLLMMSGNGVLTDGSPTSTEFRELLSNMPAKSIERFAEECLVETFSNSGLVLQDIINEVGVRLGFSVEHGYYRGVRGRVGFDGLWRDRDGHAFVVEVKTTSAYQIDLDIQAKYRNELISQGRISENQSSILIVVGRNDTGGLEAQTRGSRHAWDVRIISVDALLKLLEIKQNLSDGATVSKIHELLKPYEYTKLDRLIDIIFRTSEDLQNELVDVSDEQPIDAIDATNRTQPMNYHEECVERVIKKLDIPLIKQGKSVYTSADHATKLVCIVSKEYQRTSYPRYWYGFHPYHKEVLSDSQNAFIALGCGSASQIALIPANLFLKSLELMRTTDSPRFYWHVEIFKVGDRYKLYKPNEEGIDISTYMILEA